MSIAQLTLGPTDHGRPLTLDEFETADYTLGFKYEIIDGRLYVSPSPNFPENYLVTWLRRKLERYMEDNPEVVGYVATRGRVFVPERMRPTSPEPDIAVYATVPLDLTLRDIRWQNLSPVLVVEVLVDGDLNRDLTRNPRLYVAVPSIREYWILNGSIDPDEPELIRHRRRGKRWDVTHHPYGSTVATPLLPGFRLVVDPRK